MFLPSEISQGTILYDRRTGDELLVNNVENYGNVVFLSFKDPATGVIKREPFSQTEVEARFQIVDAGDVMFRTDPAIVSLVAEAYRLQHAFLFNDLFATETSLIDLLPHQLSAVYGVPENPQNPDGQPGMLDLPRLRFLLADDAGAGKTIMSGLLIREMLLRGMVRRVLVVPPAGLVGNWERELRVLFRLRFRILGSSDVLEDYNPFEDPHNDLAIISMDTLWRDKAREAYETAPPYDLVIFDEAHKLGARFKIDLTIDATHRYKMAEYIARQGRHLLLLTATPHMGKDDPYYLLWRLLEPELLSTREAFQRMDNSQKQNYLLRRMKEEMVRFNGERIFPPRDSKTVHYPLRQGPNQEQDLYDQVTHYCETHFDRAKLHNRSSAGLAMSILQRRLASSTFAMLKSLGRRLEKLTMLLENLEAGLIDELGLDLQQSKLPGVDVRDVKTGDEEETIDGMEEGEYQDEEIAGATDSRTAAELQLEIEEVERLVVLARQVYNQKHESKFERLWESLAEYPDTKVLIFTEFRDTLEFLISRLEGKGVTGKIAKIHGGMDYKDRDYQAEFFRKHDGARIMVATDAAGEGINLQFCWLLVNYDIPWNPARLEQRMGRVHRYKQTHRVLLLNMVSQNTREGRVLKLLLDKLETIRKELDDKVFDIIGLQFTRKPLKALILEAVIQGREAEATEVIERSLTKEQVQAKLEAHSRKVEISDINVILNALQEKREIAEIKKVMPAYIRRFFQQAAPLVGIGIKGDIEDIFYLDPYPPEFRRALDLYPIEIQDKLTFNKVEALPDFGSEPRAIYLHPGEPVFDSLMDVFLGVHGHLGIRGGVFFDGVITEPYIFYLGRVAVLQDFHSGNTHTPEVIEEKVVGIRQYVDDRYELAAPHLLLTLFPSEDSTKALDIPEYSQILKDSASDTTSAEAHFIESVGQPMIEDRRKEMERTLPVQIERLRVAYNLRRVELFKQQRLLKEAVANNIPAAQTRLRECLQELNDLDSKRRTSEAALYARRDSIRLSPVSLYVQAIVLPLPKEEIERRQDAQAEKISLEEVMKREASEGSVIDDVSAPNLKAGFDLRILRSDESIRYVEVKGRSGKPSIELTENEWTQAANHRDKYWLYVVYNCDSVPTLYRVMDPFGKLLAKKTGSVRINASDILAVSE